MEPGRTQMKNDRLTIVIVDSGVNTAHPKLCGMNITGYTYKDEKLYDEFMDTYGHGTAVFHIIAAVSNIADIINIKLPDIESSVSDIELAEVLYYIAENINCDIVNLSLGCCVCNDLQRVKKACDKLISKNTLIIAAHSNNGSFAYPAAFEHVIGVTTGALCRKTDDYEYIEDKIVNIAAKGSIQRVAWTKPEYLLVAGNSFACAHVTVQAAKFMYEGIKTEKEVLEKFRMISIQKFDTGKSKRKNKLFSIQKAAIFPFNKEIHSLVRYSDLLDFEIVSIYDTKYSAKVGAATTHLMKDQNVKELIIKNISQIDWNEFDTFILGHTDELSAAIKREDFLCNIIKQATEHKKQIYCFDDLGRLGYQNDSSIYYPKIDAGDLPPNRFGMLYRISKPVVGVFGTSSRQGKFTLQLKLRQLLQKQGYCIGQIGTEPSSLLYGMDYVFPMGYHSSVYIEGFDSIHYLNELMNDLCSREKDLILVGSQSGTVPYDTGNIVQFPVPQIEFLMGTQPDAVVLCINPYDEIHYLRRTVNFIEASVDSKVIALVVFPMNIQEDWTGIYGAKRPLSEEAYHKLKEILYTEFHIPVYQLGNECDMTALTNTIIDFF